MEFRKILCPIDFSDASRAALRAAVALTQKLGSELTLFHVYHPSGVTLPDGGVALGGPIEMAALASKIDESMKGWQAEARSLGVEAATDTAIGTTHAEIERAAEEGDYDLIVMGTHGRTGLAHVLLGSTAEKVIQRAPCPVLTVRPTW